MIFTRSCLEGTSSAIRHSRVSACQEGMESFPPIIVVPFPSTQKIQSLESYGTKVIINSKCDTAMSALGF